MNPEPDDEMPPEYDFDYSKAKPNRFVDPDYPLSDAFHAQGPQGISERSGTTGYYDEGFDDKTQRKR